MIDVEQLTNVYAAAERVSATAGALELVVVADDAGARLDAALRSLARATAADDPDLWSGLLRMAAALRWRLMTEPFPPVLCPGRRELIAEIVSRSSTLELMTDTETRRLVGALSQAARAVGEDAEPATSLLVRQTLEELDPEDSALVVEGGRACASARVWLDSVGLARQQVLTARLHLRAPVVGKAIYLGAPSVFPAGVVMAPHAQELTFVLPSWRSDRSIPASAFATFAEGVRLPKAKVFRVGEPAIIPVDQPDDQIRPEVHWAPRTEQDTSAPDIVLANRVILAGGMATYLDRDGELIRTLDPDQPPGERVELRPVDRLAPGAYLVLRQGETESEALLNRATELLGDGAGSVLHSQTRWKAQLSAVLERLGRPAVAAELRAVGVAAFNQAPAWVRPTVVRPRRERDFVLLLNWLGLDPGPFAANARKLIRARALAVAEVRSALEEGVAATDMSRLEADGFIRIESSDAGFAGIVAARVLAISPHEEAVHVTQLRAVLDDEAGRWLE